MITSPLTRKENVRKVLDIQVEDVLQLYREDYKIDVSPYFGDVSSIGIYECLETGLKFYYPQIVGDEKFYSQLQRNMNNYYGEYWKWEYEIASLYIPAESTILEIGCGSGYFLSRLKKLKKVHPLGIEMNSRALVEAQSRGIEVITENTESYLKSCREKFDVICGFQLLEHIPNVYEFLELCVNALAKGGILAFSTPNSNPFLYGYDVYHTLNLPPHHQTLWSKESFRKLTDIFKQLNLETLKAEPIDANTMKVYIDSYKKFFKKEKFSFFLIKNFMPRFFWNKVGSLIGMEGRNLVAVYKKI